MGETLRKFDPHFQKGPDRLAQETCKPIAQVARDLINWGTRVTGVFTSMGVVYEVPAQL